MDQSGSTIGLICTANKENIGCIAHDKRYASIFHRALNELRRNKTVDHQLLQELPKSCCVCFDKELSFEVETILIEEPQQLSIFQELINQVNKYPEHQPKNRISLNKLIQTLNDNKRHQLFSDLESESNQNFERQIKNELHEVPITNGDLIFLPFRFEAPQIVSSKTRKHQIGRFLVKSDKIKLLMKQYAVIINLLTEKSSQPVRRTIQMAKAGQGQFRMETLSIDEPGIWVLLRHKNQFSTTVESDLSAVKDQLREWWFASLKGRNVNPETNQ